MSKSIAERIEALEGPCREMDREIALASGWRVIADEWFVPPGLTVRYHVTELPHWTRSLDTAMTLVPEGWSWALYSDACCEIGPEPDDGHLMSAEFTTEAATPALALCAAALRAQEATNG